MPKPAGDDWHGTAQRQRQRLGLLLLLGLTTLSALRRFLPPVLRADLYEADLCQHVWWMYRFADPTLFPNDPIATFMSLPALAPYGYQALHRLLSPVLDAQLLADALPFALLVPLVLCAFWIGRLVAQGAFLGAVVGASYVVTGGMLRDIQEGLPRSFAQPLLCWGVWALLARRDGHLGLALLGGAVFYPPAVLNLGVLATVVLSYRFWRERTVPPGWRSLAVGGFGAALVLALAYTAPVPPDIGPKVTAAVARTMPEFGPAGRNRFFEPHPVDFYVRSARAGLGVSPWRLALATVAVVMCTWLFRRAIPGEAWALLGTSLGLFIVAHLTLFALHVPNRYTAYTLPLFEMIVVSAVVPRIIGAVTRWPAGARLVHLLGRPPVLPLLVCLCLIAAGASALHRLYSRLQPSPPPGQEEIYAFLQTLPKETLVAAHPVDASHIPLRTRRSVLASMETSLSYYLGYYQVMAERIGAMLTATYAVDLAELDALHTRYGVDVFLVNTKRYTPKGWGYFAPFQERVQHRLLSSGPDRFILLHPPVDRVLFHQGDFSLVRVGPSP